MIEITKPIVFFDLETTGINISSDRIIEICMLKHAPDATTETKTYRLNPTIPISPQATAIHGIGNMDVVDCPTFALLANDILEFIADSDLAGYNSNGFDIPMLIEEFMRCGISFNIDNRKCIDVMRIYKHFEKRDLSTALQFYCNRTHENAHAAEADVIATYDVFKAQLQKYNDTLQGDYAKVAEVGGMESMVDTSRRMIMKDGEPIFNFGKHKGKPVKEVLRVEPQYYDWMMKGDFALHTKQKLKEIKQSM
jgi:DNA polymerase-3 subunit epsilon